MQMLGFNTNLLVDHPFIKSVKILFILQILSLWIMVLDNICPAHDQRDFDFAKKYNLEIIKAYRQKW